MSKKKAFQVKLDLQHFAFETGVEFRGMTISQREDGWNVVLRGTDPKGVKVYGIHTGEEIEPALETLFDLLSGAEAHYFWRLDSWAKD